MTEQPDPSRAASKRPEGASSRGRSTSPEVGRSSVARIRSRVVFPAPFGPSTTIDSPAAEPDVDAGERELIAVFVA